MYSHPCRVASAKRYRSFAKLNPPFLAWLLIIGALLFNISAVQAKAKQWPAQCVHPVTGELKSNAAAHPQCDEAIQALSGTASGDTDEATELEIEPSSHDFGAVNMGQTSAERQITLFNNGDQPLQLDFIDELGNVTTTLDEMGNVTTAFGYQALDDLGNPTTLSEFRITDDSCSNTELSITPSPSAACELTLVFEPQALGTKTFNLPIPYLDEFGNPTSLAVPLSGQGVDIPIPNIGATLMSHDFEEINIGSESDVQTIRISNSGDGELNIGQVTLPNTADFILLYDFCSSQTLSSDQNCSLRIQFKPQTVGAKTATLAIVSDDPSTPTLEIALSGEGTLPPTPNIEMEEASYDFGETQVGTTSEFKVARVMNTGNAPLQLGQISLVGSEFMIKYDLCSNKTLSPSRYCSVIMQFKPISVGAKTANLSIPSNDPDMPTLEVPLNGTATGWCQGNYEQGFSTYPQTPDFGTEVVGGSIFMQQSVYTWARGCGALHIETITVTGTDAAEFSITNQHCYNGSWQDQAYSSCYFKLVFSPTVAGTKTAELTATFNDTSVKTIPLQATAVNPPAQPNLSVSPNAFDFGTVMVARQSESQILTLQNAGNVNLSFNQIELTGIAASEFSVNKWNCYYRRFLRPSEHCYINTQFTPISTGSKQAQLTITSNSANMASVNVPLTGIAEESKDCSDDNITIESATNGIWATETPNGYTGDSDAWIRRSVSNGSVAPNRPTENDVVRINGDHTIIGIPFAKVRTLCIAPNANLESLDRAGTPLEIQATDYIENKGNIIGLPGVDDMPGATSCTSKQTIGNRKCANPGASILLKVGKSFQKHGKMGDWWWYGSGGPILNTGMIQAGNGGNGSQYGAPGGDAIVLGRNTLNRGTIQAGKGGNVTGTTTGEGGRGGLTQIWGKLGGPGHLYNINGAEALAGDGGSCSGDNQIGGRGGNLWLVSLPNVHLSNGIFKAGKGGTGCTTPGGDGWVRIEPSVIDLSGSNTKIEGGDITIFGGKDWTLDLSNLSDTALTATGNITLAVGKGGSINLSGSSGKILKSGGQITLFADNIVLDEDVALSALVEANSIVAGPSKILRDVALVGPGTLIGKPGETLQVNLTLTNNGAEADTYALSVTDTAGWHLGQLPYIVEIEGLASVSLVLNVTLPAEEEVTDIISINAISQLAPDTHSTATVLVSTTEKGDSVTLDEGILNLPGIDTNVNGGDVTISSSEDGTLDLSNVGGSKVVSATGKITLAVSENGFIDLRGNNSAILETTGEVIIFANPDNILLDPGVKLEDIIKASNIVVLPSKPSHNAALTGLRSSLSKPANAIVPLRFTLANTGMETDAYTLNATDSAGWRMTPLPKLKRIKGLDSVDLLMNVTLPETVGETNVITVTATSKAKPSLVVTARVNLTVTSASLSGTVVGVSPINTSGLCPNSGPISRMCSNRGRVITDGKLDSSASVSGGSFAGSIENQGMIAQATIESGAVLHGGKLSGRIKNQGTLADFDFVGAEIKGGTLSGKITNRSKVGGVFIDVHLDADTQIDGGAIAGDVTGKAEAPASLTDIEVKSGTHLSHVVLGDAVQLDGTVTFTDVYLAPDVQLIGGKVRGNLIGDLKAPGLLENITIEAGSQLSAVIIGDDVKLPKAITLGEGVVFTNRDTIPSGVELLGILPSRGDEIAGVSYERRRVDLSVDVYEPSDGILSAINDLSVFKDNDWVFTQESDSGLMTLRIDTVSFSLLPVSIKGSTGPVGLEIEGSQGIYFITDTGLAVLTRPMLEAPGALQSALSELDLPEFTVQGNGNLSIPGDGNVWYSANPDGLSFEVSGDIETGLMMLDSPVLSGTPSAALAFSDKGGNVRQQLIYPAPAQPEALYSTAQNVSIEAHGLMSFSLKGKKYRGVVDYAVKNDGGSTTDALQVESIADANGDGIKDVVLKYPNGNQQTMFVLE